MKRCTKYVALDVHQATTVASVREESGRVIARTILPTEAPALLKAGLGGRRSGVTRRPRNTVTADEAPRCVRGPRVAAEPILDHITHPRWRSNGCGNN
jgi:hypothetical protein